MSLPSRNSTFFSIYNQKERPLEWWLSVFFLYFLVINQKKITFTLILTYLYTYLIAHSLYEEMLLNNLKILFRKIDIEQKTTSLVSLY